MPTTIINQKGPQKRATTALNISPWMQNWELTAWLSVVVLPNFIQLHWTG